MVKETPRNLLLGDLESAELTALRSHAQAVSLESGAVIAESGEATPYSYFPLEGVISLVGTTGEGATVEVALVGKEGVASLPAVLGGNTQPFRVVSQIAGKALQIPTDLVVQHLKECSGFHDRLLAYTQSLIAQASQSAICNRYHNAPQRLARWLLMTADRAGTRVFPLTHDFIARMIGGPRSAVTEAAAVLREAGAVEYARGRFVISSLARLRSASCECYDALVYQTG